MAGSSMAGGAAAGSGSGTGVTLPISESSVTGLVADLASKATLPIAESSVTGLVADLASKATLPISESSVTGLTADLASKAVKSANLSDLADPSAARTALGLGTAALSNAVDFDASGAGAAQALAAINAEPITLPAIIAKGVVGGFVDNASAFSPTTQSVPRQFTDGVTTSGSPNFSSAAGAAFVAGDVGAPIMHANFPANTTILSRTATTAVASNNATASGTALTMAIGSNVAAGEPCKRMANVATGAGSVAILMWSFEVPITATNLDVRLRTTLGQASGGTGNFKVQPLWQAIADSAYPAGEGLHTQPSALAGFSFGAIKTPAISATSTSVRTSEWTSLAIPAGSRRVIFLFRFDMVDPQWTATLPLDILNMRVTAT